MRIKDNMRLNYNNYVISRNQCAYIKIFILDYIKRFSRFNKTMHV